MKLLQIFHAHFGYAGQRVAVQLEALRRPHIPEKGEKLTKQPQSRTESILWKQDRLAPCATQRGGDKWAKMSGYGSTRFVHPIS